MASEVPVHATVDAWLKEEAATILSEIGLTLSDVMRMALVRVVECGTLPPELRVPNAETRAAMAESRTAMAERRARFRSAGELSDALDREMGKEMGKEIGK
ncbi:MAG: type II toxin-antitoxin system RelB/DinJ family antitoxin [Alphaproteobacteria bacterium]|nr:type II toxin-antitoxin system RelB/DinJ family antitoxin [Alphaproteobacteria bacterium]